MRDLTEKILLLDKNKLIAHHPQHEAGISERSQNMRRRYKQCFNLLISAVKISFKAENIFDKITKNKNVF